MRGYGKENVEYLSPDASGMSRQQARSVLKSGARRRLMPLRTPRNEADDTGSPGVSRVLEMGGHASKREAVQSRCNTPKSSRKKGPTLADRNAEAMRKHMERLKAKKQGGPARPSTTANTARKRPSSARERSSATDVSRARRPVSAVSTARNPKVAETSRTTSVRKQKKATTVSKPFSFASDKRANEKKQMKTTQRGINVSGSMVFGLPEPQMQRVGERTAFVDESDAAMPAVRKCATPHDKRRGEKLSLEDLDFVEDSSAYESIYTGHGITTVDGTEAVEKRKSIHAGALRVRRPGMSSSRTGNVPAKRQLTQSSASLSHSTMSAAEKQDLNQSASFVRKNIRPSNLCCTQRSFLGMSATSMAASGIASSEQTASSPKPSSPEAKIGQAIAEVLANRSPEHADARRHIQQTLSCSGVVKPSGDSSVFTADMALERAVVQSSSQQTLRRGVKLTNEHVLSDALELYFAVDDEDCDSEVGSWVEEPIVHRARESSNPLAKTFNLVTQHMMQPIEAELITPHQHRTNFLRDLR